MKILIRCDKCRKFNSVSSKKCSCGFIYIKFKNYYLDFSVNGKRKRKSVGRYDSIKIAQIELGRIQKDITEGRFLSKSKNSVSLKSVFNWAKKHGLKTGYESILNEWLTQLGQETLILNLQVDTLSKVMDTWKTRLKPASINRKVAILKSMLNSAVQNGIIESNPIASFKLLPVNNTRDRILSNDEFISLVKFSPEWLRPIILMAFYTAMRKTEITELRWGEIDLKNKFIRLSGKRTKNGFARNIPMHQIIFDLLNSMPTENRFKREYKVFDLPADIHRPYKKAVEKAGLDDFTFHSLRHCAINNFRLAGNDQIAITAISGHRTDSVFRRYNFVTEDELKNTKWVKGV